MTTTGNLIADLEAGLAAAKALAAGDMPPAAAPAASAVPAVDTSMMPGGADSAPANAAEPVAATETADWDLKPVLAETEHAAETEGLNLIDKLKDGKTVKEVAGLLHDVESSTAVESIVQAISDIAQGVRI